MPHPMLLENFNISMVTHITPEKEKIHNLVEEEVKVFDEPKDLIFEEEDEEMKRIDAELNAHALAW